MQQFCHHARPYAREIIEEFPVGSTKRLAAIGWGERERVVIGFEPNQQEPNLVSAPPR